MRPPTFLTISWMVGGLSWVAAAFSSWTSQGLLSQSSRIDAARFVRQGSIEDVMPAGAAFVLLLPAVAGLLLMALAGLGGPPASVGRAAVGLVGTAVIVVLAGRLTGWTPGRAGPGVLVAVAGVALVTASTLAQGILARTARVPTPDQ